MTHRALIPERNVEIVSARREGIFIHADRIYLEHARNIHKLRERERERYRSVYARRELLNNIRVQLVARVFHVRGKDRISAPRRDFQATGMTVRAIALASEEI